MRIGLDIQATEGPQSGLGVFTSNYVGELKKTVEEAQLELSLYSVSARNAWGTLRRLWWENIQLPRRAKKDNLDLLHVPAFSPPIKVRAKLIVTVHDIIGALFPNQKGSVSQYYWGSWLPARIASSDAILADSFHTKGDIVEHLGINAEKIHVIYPSGHEGFKVHSDVNERRKTLGKIGVVGNYLLFVGTIEPRKNLKNVIKAFINLRKNYTKVAGELKFVVVGSKDFGHGKFFEELSAQFKDIAKDVIFTGYVSHNELNILYSGAVCFVFPSLYEGFGMPVLEAMAAGAPVITSNSTSLPEVAGKAAIQINPVNVDEITMAMYEIVVDVEKQQSMREAGFDNIKRFSWKKTVQESVAIYKAVLG